MKEIKTGLPKLKKKRRQKKEETIRNQKNRLWKWRKAPESKIAGLKSSWEKLKKEQGKLGKAEKAGIKRSAQLGSRRRLFKDQFIFVKALLEQP